jgi:ABC-type transport system involved in multi-copper enzyme maturation permease subunit
MINLLQAELLKLSRRPLTWVLLAVLLASLLLYMGVAFVFVALHEGVFSGGATRIAVLSQVQVDEFRRWVTLPGVFGTVLSQVNSIGGICAIILAAGSLGSEYSWGTLRLHLSRQPNRGRYLLAKLLALLLVLLSWIMLALLLGVALAALCGAVLGGMGSIAPGDMALLPLAVARALYVMLPYLLVTLAACALGRSVLAGVGGGIAFLLFDASLGGLSLVVQESSALSFFYNLLLQQNVSTLSLLNSTSFGLNPALMVRTLDLSLLPHPVQATVLVGIYSLICFVCAYYALVQRDVRGAG